MVWCHVTRDDDGGGSIRVDSRIPTKLSSQNFKQGDYPCSRPYVTKAACSIQEEEEDHTMNTKNAGRKVLDAISGQFSFPHLNTLDNPICYCSVLLSRNDLQWRRTRIWGTVTFWLSETWQWKLSTWGCNLYLPGSYETKFTKLLPGYQKIWAFWLDQSFGSPPKNCKSWPMTEWRREPEPLTSYPQVDVMVSEELHSRKIRSVLTKPCIRFTWKMIRNPTFRPIS